MSNQSGVIKDASGESVTVHPVRETTFGEPAGLWGINCSHQPDPFIPGWSESKRPIEQGEVNARYEETQKQRYHEQQVKKWKRAAVAADASGDTDAFREAAAKVKQKQAALRDYCERTNLPYQSDRVQVYGYSRSTAGKATQAVRRAS
ncbi:MAG TPA: hypothetical protein PLP25_00245, partial [Candidatus Limiplasma sp.]|nr:hypothetical protein [Candidatus Limiplasma sp.]HPS80271.1 hypothetical protein [Candidatus Limiplasma sp.]